MGVGQVVGGHPDWTLAVAVALVLILVLAWRAGAAKSVLLWVVGRVPQLRRILDTVELTRLYRTLALLLSGGMPLVASLELAAGALPPSTALQVRQVRRRISEGQAFSDSFEHERLSTPVADRFFRVGERTGRLAEMIDRAADFHEDEVGRAADWLGRVIGPVMMLVMGVLIGVVVVLMYLPIFQLSEALQ
jgi:general secretion pathway protein F